jgi:hypothetical protein
MGTVLAPNLIGLIRCWPIDSAIINSSPDLFYALMNIHKGHSRDVRYGESNSRLKYDKCVNENLGADLRATFRRQASPT